MGAAASARDIQPVATLKRKAPTTPPNNPNKQVKREPINYRPVYEAASAQQKEDWMCITNTAKYCYSPWDEKRQAKLLDGFDMSEDQMYAWMAFSYSVKCNFAQPTDGFSPQEYDTEPGLYYEKKQKQMWMEYNKEDGFVVCSEK